jgi:chaperonin GroEL
MSEVSITPFLKKFIAAGRKDLIIFTSDMDNEVIRRLINTHQSKAMNICVVKAPIIFKDMVFEDFAKATGATIVEDATGVSFNNLNLQHLGTCDRIEIEKEEIVLNPSVDLTEHIADLKAKGDEDSLRRVFWLTTKTAKIKLGAVNEGELSLLRLSALDAIHSSQLALQGGIVAGGGVALLNAGRLDNKLMREVLQAPMKQIIINSNVEVPKDLFLQYGSSLEGSPEYKKIQFGFNAKTRKDENMFEAGIVDSAIVQKNAIKNAIHIALRAITTNTFIDLPKRSTEDLQLEILGRQMRNF